MNKRDVQELYKRAKRRQNEKRAAAGLFGTSAPRKKSGCKTCGKVTWKPY